MQPFFSPNGAHDPRRFIRRPRKLRTRTRDRIRCSTQKVLASISPYMFITHTKMSIFFRKGRSWTYILEKQPGKLMLETFSWGNNWANHSTDKNRQSMTSCGNCCYYLERSKVNHIAIKWTKYENVDGLVALHKIWWSPNFFKTFGNLRDANKTSRVWYQTKWQNRMAQLTL